MSNISQTYIFNLPKSQHSKIDNLLNSKPSNIKKIFKLDTNYYYTIKNYLLKVKRNGYTFNDKFTLSDSGRMYGINTTIQKLSNELRSYIFGDTVYDIDMINASFNCVKYIINSYFPNKKDNFKVLFDYCLNRNPYFKNNMDKLQYIYCLFSPNPKSYLKNYLDENIKNLINEINEFHILINDNLHLFNHTFKDSSPLGSKISYIIYHIENQILQDILKEYKNITICPVFDGLLINSEYNLKNSLKDINNITKKYDIQLLHKVFPKIDFEDSPPEYNNEYVNMKEQFEKNHFLVEDPLQFIRTYKNKDGIQISYYNKRDFADLVSTFQIEDKPFLNKWIADEERRSFKKLEWYPNLEKCDPQNFNTFTGLKGKIIQNVNMEKVNKFIDHIKLLTNYEEEATNYLIKYCSDMFQNPQNLPGTAILIKSEQGVGKDIFTDILGSCLGDDLIHKEPKMDNITGTFNKNLKNKLIIQLNEVCGKDGHFNKDLLKDLITCNFINVRKMRTDTEKIRNFMRLFLFTNNLNPIDIPADNRRYLVFQSGKKKDEKYYNELLKLITDEEAINSIFTYLMNYDLGDFKPRQMCKTDALLNLQKHNSNPFYEFLFEIINKPKENRIIKKNKEHFILSKNLEGLYNKFLDANYSHIISNSKNNKTVLLDLRAKDIRLTLKNKQYRGFKFNIEEMKETLIKSHNVLNNEEIIDLNNEDFSDFIDEFESDND